MRVLVFGGAGYIGSHMCRMLADRGHEVAAYDDLSTGHEPSVRWGRLFRGDLLDAARLAAVFAEFRPEGIMHFAAKSLVPESVAHPDRYYRANVAGTLNVLELARGNACPIVFSSTCAIFGAAQTPRIDESHPRNPITPYGRSKLMVETMLGDYWSAYQLPSVSLRYFNAAGADPSGEIGESHDPETHLVPIVLESLLGRRGAVSVYGNDYPTRDGTCIRDYIHINDLCEAHLLGLELMRRTPGCYAFNLGNGSGFSVKEVIAAATKVTGRRVDYAFVERRPGDPPELVADASKAQRELGWQPRHPTLEAIIESAWRWHQDRKF